MHRPSASNSGIMVNYGEFNFLLFRGLPVHVLGRPWNAVEVSWLFMPLNKEQSRIMRAAHASAASVTQQVIYVATGSAFVAACIALMLLG